MTRFIKILLASQAYIWLIVLLIQNKMKASASIFLFCLMAGFLADAQIADAQPQLRLVKTVRQKGPVAYRDPFGAISPDGNLFAYSDLRKVVVQPLDGGSITELKKNGAFIRYLTWTLDGDLVTYEIGGDSKTWYIYDLKSDKGSPLWPEIENFKVLLRDSSEVEISRSEIRELSWSTTRKQVAGSAFKNGKTHIIVFDQNGSNPRVIASEDKIESVQWNPTRSGWAGIVTKNGKRFIDLNLGFASNILLEANSYGRIAFSHNDPFLYYTEGNENGLLDLWKHDLLKNTKERLTYFTKDTYEPSVTKEGSILFKLQDYRIFIATVSGEGGMVQTLTGFQSEIPYWHPTGDKISFTYGRWRRIMDDAKYPDIDQHLGVVNVDRDSPAEAPEEIVRASYSEDQGMCWSPNLKWVAFHTHADGTDDIWLQPSGDASKGKPLSKGGYETGWPRWSPDGNWIVSNTAYSKERINKLFLIGIDQNKGKVTTPQKQLIPQGLEEGSITDSQWTSDSKNLVVEYVIDENNKEIHLVPIEGGPGKKIHAFESDQLYSGIGLSNDDKWVAYIAPDENGNFQVFKVSIDSSEVKQVTTDPTDKAHPVYSPTEDRIAFSVFNYQVLFWMFVN